MSTRISIILLSSLLAASAARAQTDDSVSQSLTTRQSASAGRLLVHTHPAALDGQAALVSALGGYDSARRTGLFEAAAEVRVWGLLSVRGGAVYTSGDGRLRPSFGGRLQLLAESARGLDGAIGVFYRPEGLTEPEGELEAVVSAGRHAGETYLAANLVYGQDPEGNERDGELRLAAVHPLAERLLLGLDGKLRFDLGSDRARQAHRGEPRLDAVAGPLLTLFVGPVAILAQAGASAVAFSDRTAFGAFVVSGLAGAF
jgi:hypothetical protein